MFKHLFDRLMTLIVTPRKAWKEIVDNPVNESDFKKDYIFPLMGLVALASFIGNVSQHDVTTAVRSGSVTFISLFAGFYLSAYLLNEVMTYFGQKKSLEKMHIFVGLSSSIMYALNIFLELQFVPEFFFLQVFIFYTAYVLWESLGIFFDIPEDQRIVFIILAFFAIVLSPIVIETILEKLIY